MTQKNIRTETALLIIVIIALPVRAQQILSLAQSNNRQAANILDIFDKEHYIFTAYNQGTSNALASIVYQVNPSRTGLNLFSSTFFMKTGTGLQGGSDFNNVIFANLEVTQLTKTGPTTFTYSPFASYVGGLHTGDGLLSWSCRKGTSLCYNQSNQVGNEYFYYIDTSGDFTKLVPYLETRPPNTDYTNYGRNFPLVNSAFCYIVGFNLDNVIDFSSVGKNGLVVTKQHNLGALNWGRMMKPER